MFGFCVDKTVSVIVDKQQIVSRIRQWSDARVVEYPTNDIGWTNFDACCEAGLVHPKCEATEPQARLFLGFLLLPASIA